ncbi:MAG: zinc ribbon domain-containing protein [Candidatus Hydrogenedentes bacterium]|nr:zinc ribbon domain-containing protein [Candidatus Hydrogenedentota bacterium]
MPLFTYICRKCQTEAELLVSNGESPLCPECGARTLERQASLITPLDAPQGASAPQGCGAQSCCPMQGGCPLN